MCVSPPRPAPRQHSLLLPLLPAILVGFFLLLIFTELQFLRIVHFIMDACHSNQDEGSRKEKQIQKGAVNSGGSRSKKGMGYCKSSFSLRKLFPNTPLSSKGVFPLWPFARGSRCLLFLQKRIQQISQIKTSAATLWMVLPLFLRWTDGALWVNA